MPPDEFDMTVPHPPRSLSGRLRRAAHTTVAALTVLAGVFAPALSATAATESPSPETGPDVSIVLAPENQGAYTSGLPLAAAIAIDNDGESAAPAGQITLDLGRTALSDRASLLAWLNDGTTAQPLSPLGETASTEVGADSAASASLVVSSALVGELPPGVYPLRATLTFAQTTDGDALDPVTAQSAIIVSATGSTADSAVSALVPITANPSGSILSADELTALTAADGALTLQLSAVAGTGAVLAIDPAIPAAIRALGTAAPLSAVDWLQRLETLPNERFLLQFNDADLTAQVSAGLDSPLQPTTLAPFLDPRGFAETDDSATPSPSPDAAPATAELPTDEELTALVGARTNIYWPRGDISPDDLAALSRFVTGSGDPVTVLPSSSFAEGADAAPVAVRADASGATVLVADSALSAALSRVAAEDNPLHRGAPLAEARALRWFTDPQASLLVAFDRNENRSADGLKDALTALSGGHTGTLAELLSASPALVSVSSESSAVRAASVTTLLDGEAQIRDFATILADPAQLTARERLSILSLLAVGEHSTDEDYSAAFGAHRQTTTETLNAVGIQPSNPILISSSVDVPAWLRNDLPYPVTVQLDARPSDPRLEVDGMMTIEGAAATTTRIKIPVTARIASGEVDLIMDLTSPTGVHIGTTQVAQLTVRAEWETIGLIVFGSLAVLLIGAGVVRTVFRRRADARTALAQDAPEPTDR